MCCGRYVVGDVLVVRAIATTHSSSLKLFDTLSLYSNLIST